MAPAVAPHEHILKALDDATKYNNELLLSIQNLLSPIGDAKHDKSAKENAPVKVGHARAKSAVTTKVTAKAKANGHARQLTTVTVKQEVVLKQSERVNLAFQVINGCIKNLSRLAKEHALAKRAGSHGKDGSRTALSTATVPPDTALRPISPNAKRFRSIDETCAIAPSKSNPAGRVAACAGAALSFLRDHYPVQGAADKTYQVENGTLAVIAKCIELDLLGPAIDQLQFLKARLLEHLGSKPAKKQQKSAESTHQKLLSFPAEVRDSPVLQFAVKVQQHVLQVLCLPDHAASIEELSTVLAQQDAPRRTFAPFFEHSSNSKDKEKASRQLSMLPRLVSQLCTVNGVSAEAIFRLRITTSSLQIEVADLNGGLKADEIKDMGLRLARCIEVFGKTSKHKPKEQYETAALLVTPLVQALDLKSDPTSLTHAGRSMSQLALRAGLVSQSKSWSGSLGQETMPASDVVKLAAAGICSEDCQRLLANASDILTSNLPSDQASLDKLLVEVVGLRKALHKAVSDVSRRGEQCLAAAVACISFLRQYAGVDSPAIDARDAADTNRRLEMARKFAKPFVNTIVVCCLKSTTYNDESCASLALCNEFLLEIIREDDTYRDQCFTDSKNAETSIFVTLSKVGHKIWLHQIEKRGQDDGIGIRALVQSIKALEPWSCGEKEAGAFSSKLQYLVDAYIACEDWERAQIANMQLMSYFKDGGLLQKLVDVAATTPLHTLAGKGAEGRDVYRCLRSFVTLSLRIAEPKAHLVHGRLQLAPAAQGLLLEWQLELLSQNVQQERSTSPVLAELVKMTLEALMEVYTEKDFPVRRLRVLTQAARLSSFLPLDADLWETDSVVTAKVVKLKGDVGLKSYLPAMQVQLRSMLALNRAFDQEDRTAIDASLQEWDDLCLGLTSADSVKTTLYDLDALVEHLTGFSDFFSMQFEPRSEARLLENLAWVIGLLPEHCVQAAELQCRLAQVYVGLGYTGIAQELLSKAKPVACSKGASISTQLVWHLANAAHLLATGDLEACTRAVQQAAAIATDGDDQSFAYTTFNFPSLNIDNRRLIARFAILQSKLELQQGQPARALKLCLTAKSMLFKIWSSVEQLMPHQQTITSLVTRSSGCSTSDYQTSAMEDVQPVVVTRSYSHLTNARLRMLVPELMDTALLEMRTHDFRGSYHDAFAALKHANKIAGSVGLGAACLCDVAAAELYLRSLPLDVGAGAAESKINDAEQRLGMVDEGFLRKSGSVEMVRVGLARARLGAVTDGVDEQLPRLQNVLAVVKDLNAIAPVTRVRAAVEFADELAEQMAAMQIGKPKKGARATKAKTAATKPAPKARGTKASTTKKTDSPASVAPDNVLLRKRHAKVLAEILEASIAQGSCDTEQLAALLEEMSQLGFGSGQDEQCCFSRASLLIHQAHEQIAADITFNALPESINVVPPPRQQVRPVIELKESPKKPSAKTVKKPAAKGRATAKAKEAAVTKTSTSAVPPFLDLLRSAHDTLQADASQFQKSATMAVFRKRSWVTSNVALTISASSCESGNLTHPLQCAHHLDAPNIRQHELNKVIDQPEVEKLTKDDLRRWPSLAVDSFDVASTRLDGLSLQRDYIDILPRAWNVVSMSLTQDKKALTLTRYRNGQSPFILRVPFAHREDDDEDAEVMDMAAAYARLREIIKQHEFAPADPSVTDKAEFRKKWWARKHELNEELKALLSDVEDAWFTAVKGIFSPHVASPQGLSNLQAQLEGVLAKHCPAAKKPKGKGKAPAPSLKIEPRFLELFIGLGDPNAEVDDGEGGIEPLAESTRMTNGVQDLIELILQNLQFSGESIAIDEIDIDSLILEVIDALRDYFAHTAAESRRQCSHTILVLDNQLHGFPWESMPVLRGQSLSRLPSLAALRERILGAGLAGSQADMPTKTVSRASGTSLLNPSGDLTKTAKRFEPWLQRLPPSWAHLGRAPDDEGWTAMLSENELFLYVGHGGTGQYVRPRVVKRLAYPSPPTSPRSPSAMEGVEQDVKQTCAVSWLIGCSSVAVEDLGDEFAPNGMVLSYLSAGAPAVLGALWDVGDIDADYFSIGAGEYWGFWDDKDEQGLDEKMKALRGRVREDKARDDLEMCEAVARSRELCKLSYLNGAAFVTYGIPVVLGD